MDEIQCVFNHWDILIVYVNSGPTLSDPGGIWLRALPESGCIISYKSLGSFICLLVCKVGMIKNRIIEMIRE